MLKNGKFPFRDLVPYEVLKRPQLLDALTRVCNLCLESGKISSEWWKSIICPIYKDKGLEKRLPSSYWGISLLSCFKICNSLLNNRVMLFVECDDKLHVVDEQNGFRHGRSCEGHLFVLSSTFVII